MKATRSYTVRPTVFGCVVGVALIVLAVFRPSVADPSATGLVWAGIAAAWVIGILWPLLSLQRIAVVVRDNVVDAQVGTTTVMDVAIEGYGLGVSIHVTGMESIYSDITLPADLDLPIAVAERGMFHRVQIEVSTDAPFGIVWVTRRIVVPLAHPMVVGPCPVPYQVQPDAILRGDEDVATQDLHPSSDTIRSVRPYMAGDPFHFVDWKSTARRGEVIIKEFDPPAQHVICLVLQLTDPPTGNRNGQSSRLLDPNNPNNTASGSQTATLADPLQGQNSADIAHHRSQERHVSETLGACQHALGIGMRVVLCTWEQSGDSLQQRCQEIEHPLMAQRQLALAVPAPMGQLPTNNIPEGWPVRVIGDVNG